MSRLRVPRSLQRRARRPELRVVATVLAIVGASATITYIVRADRPSDVASVMGTVLAVIVAGERRCRSSARCRAVTRRRNRSTTTWPSRCCGSTTSCAAPFGGGFEVVRRLVERGRVALLLDGLDEMPDAARVDALRAINQLTRFRMVISTRPYEYDEATRLGRLHRSLVVELLPVDPRRAIEYLLQDYGDRHGSGWEKVADELIGNEGGPLAQALDTPLMLSLVRDAYPPDPNPTS